MLRERCIGLRNRLLADARFQRWATRFPLTRPVAQARAARLFDLTAGFVYSQVLAACVELDAFEKAAVAPIGPSDLDLPEDGARRLLRAASGIGLLEQLGHDRYALGSEGAALRGNPGVAEMIRHHRLLYADLADPVAMLRSKGGGALARHWPYAQSTQGDAAPYSALMAASQPMVAAQVLDAYPFHRHRRVLDIGGGNGAFLAALAARHPRLDLTLFDLPEVVALPGVGTAERVGGSFTHPLPEGADLVTLIRILHDHDDATVQALLRNVRTSLAPGGRVLIAEPMADTQGVSSYFEIYLWAMGSGRPRTPHELRQMLRSAGFTNVRKHRSSLPLVMQVISADR